MDGSTSPTCDIVTGQCTCKENIVGTNCDSCEQGISGFPDCSREGTF